MAGTTAHLIFLATGLVLCTWSVALSCDSCGRECQAACGTRNFRTCCFNYLRKRSDGNQLERPGLRLELLVVPELAARYWEDHLKPHPVVFTEPEETTENARGHMQLIYNP